VNAVNSNVTFSAVNTPIAPPAGADNRITEMVTAVPGCGTDYWIIVHGSYLDTNPTFRHALFVYPLNASGIGMPTAYSVVGPARFGQLKASPDGTRIAYGTGDPNSADGTNSGYAHVVDFNRNTGVISNPRVIDRYVYGVSFSPNSQLLYLTDSVSGPGPKIFQYDLSAANLNATERLVANVPEDYSALQLGPDRKIYVALHNNNNHLAVINYPDQRNTVTAPNACGYSYNGPFLNIPATATAVNSIYGLPNMIDAQKASAIPADFTYTISSCSTVNFQAPACASSYSWDFGDSATSTTQNPSHTYTAHGTYTVSLILNGTTSATHAVTIGLPATATTIFGQSLVCMTGGNPPFFNYSANAQLGWTYNWAATGGTISGVSNSNNVDVVWNTFPGTVQLTVTDPATGCSTTTSLTVIQSSASDLYMKDTMAPDVPEDFGAEPTVSQTLYISRDIWVRTSADTIAGSTNPGPDTTLAADSYYANEHQHQNPTYVNASTLSYVYVKVRNRGCASSTGSEKLRVYWADASTGLPWPDLNLWHEFDCVAGGAIDPCSLPVLAPGQDYVVELPWNVPDPVPYGGSGHFCLVARIETTPTAPYGMTSDESQNQWLWQNVAGNNNIAWKNLTVFNGSGKATVIVRNTLLHEAPVELHFATPVADLKNHFLLHGDIFVDLGDALMKKWRQGEQRPQGFEVAGKTTIKLTDPSNAVLAGLLFGAGEQQTMEVRMQLKPGDQTRPGTSFDFDVIQMAPATKTTNRMAIGGVRYNLIVPEPTRTHPWNRFFVCGLLAAVLGFAIGMIAVTIRYFRARSSRRNVFP
jgi:PKD repeat protein